jgi:predicted Zn-dependent peptidase
VNGIRVSTLANGLRVATDPVASVETASVGVWVAAGSRYESPKIGGVSHFLEHMVFKGTPRRDARAIAEEIEAVGGHLNAHTSREYTAFYAKVLKEDVGLAVNIIADILQNPNLDAEELDRERTVVLQEIMQSFDTPDDVVFDRFQETAFPDQALGRSVLGSSELIRGMTREDLVRYLRDHYRASRMVLAAAGRVDHEALVAMAESAFDGLVAGDSRTSEPARYTGGDWREERDLEQVHLVLGFEGLGYRDPDFYALSVLSTLLGGGMSSRLFQEAREQRGLCYDIHAFGWGFSDTGLFGIHAATGTPQVEELVQVIMSELRAVAVDGPTDAELERAKAQIKASLLMGLESSEACAAQLARDLLLFGRQIPTTELIERIDNVSRMDVGALAASFVLMKQPVTASVGPKEVSDRLRNAVTESSAREMVH